MANLLTTKEIADIFKVTVQTVWRWRVAGLPHIKINSQTIRYNLDDVIEWMEEKHHDSN
jgi:phage terminase Nu1 subunit (DNA packaging protein)